MKMIFAYKTPSRFVLLTILSFAFIFIVTLNVNAQSKPSAEKPVIFHTLSIKGDIQGLYYDLGKKSILLTAGPTSLSQPYTSPAGGILKVYRLGPPDDSSGSEPTRIPVAEANIGKEGPYIVLFSGINDGPLQMRVIDDSWKVHPLGSSRVLNVSVRNTAVLLDKDTAELRTGQLHLFPPHADKDVVEFKVATYEDDQWIIRVLTPQAIYPNTRNTFIIKDQTPSRENPNPMGLDVFNIIDTNQPPLKPLVQ